MISRRLFLQLLSWGTVSTVLCTPSPGASLENSRDVSSGDFQSRTEYYVSTAGGVASVAEWSATKTEEDVVLEWETDFEYENDGFRIEHQGPETRSADTWETLGFVEGRGTTYRSTQYRYVVSESLAAGRHQFRLTQVGNKGGEKITEIRSVPIEGIVKWKADNTSQGITLRWETIFSDPIPRKFVVEQRSAGSEESDWRELGAVDAKEDSSRSSSYRYITSDLSLGSHRFRLKQVKENGEVEYTDIISSLVSGISEWEADKNEEEIVLQWTTAAEYKNDGFAVQHTRPDQEEWETLKFVDGEGTTAAPTSYRHVVSDLPPGRHRFRLKQVKEDGEVEHTDIISSLVNGISEWEADKNEEGIVLQWKTAAEYENDGFAVQHTRPDQEEWETLKFVDGEDTTSIPTSYRHVVSDLPPGEHRFRLKQMKKDGDVEYTESISARARGISAWMADKNDSSGDVVLQWTTAAEYRNEVFSVQHAGPEQEDWETLEFIEGQGATSTSTDYRHVVSNLSPGSHRFRLEQTNQIRDNEYTEVISKRISGIMEWTAHKTNEGVELQWRTAVPEKDEAYIVEHQSPGESKSSWKTLERIEKQKSQSSKHSYTATDLVPGTHRFRLRLVEETGAPKHTDPVSILQEMDKSVRLTPPAPNPIRTQATLSFAVRGKQPATIKMYDVLGQEVNVLYRGTPSPGENQVVRFDVSGLASGAYFVRLVTGDHVKTRRCTVLH